MTDDRDFKRIVRARAAKTGESYQAARRVLTGDDPLFAARVTTTFDRPVGRVLGCATEAGTVSRGMVVAVTAPDGSRHRATVVSLRRGWADVVSGTADDPPEFGLIVDPPYYGAIPAEVTGDRPT